LQREVKQLELKELNLEIENLNQKIDEILLKDDTKANEKEFDKISLRLKTLRKERYYK
jgi:hypothetical protein